MPAQKPNVKKLPPLKNQVEELRKEGKFLFNQFVEKLVGMVGNWRQYRDIIKNNYELGRDHLRRGNLKDAILRFKFVLWLEPKHPGVWYYLGRSYLAGGNKKSARDAFRKALLQKPGDEDAAYLMAIAGGKATPENELPGRIPPSLARQHFDSLAVDYDKEQLIHYQYQGHTQLATALRANLVPGRMDHVILDLGVGTGLCGPLLRDVAAQLTGVDMSAPMLAIAMKLYDGNGKKTYDALINRDITEFLPTAQAHGFDIVMACGVLSYIGALDGLFQQVARVLKPGGVFAFTADKMEGGGFRFDTEAARFLFSKTYLEKMAQEHGLKKSVLEEMAIYPAYTAWVCVFKN